MPYTEVMFATELDFLLGLGVKRSAWGFRTSPEASLQDFTYVAGFTVAPLVVGVPASSPFKTLDDLVKEAKAKPTGNGKSASARRGAFDDIDDDVPFVTQNSIW